MPMRDEAVSYTHLDVYKRQADVDIAQKTDELLEKFLGKRFYSDMEAAGLKFGVITIGE